MSRVARIVMRNPKEEITYSTSTSMSRVARIVMGNLNKLPTSTS
jgi:hypothetical protein